jgi:hypothetical protein
VESSLQVAGQRRPPGDVVKFGWDMVSSSGEVAGVRLEFVILDADGRIGTDYRVHVERHCPGRRVT